MPRFWTSRSLRALPLLLPLLSLFTPGGPALAKPPRAAKVPEAQPAPLPDLKPPTPLPLERFVLGNGLRVVVQTDARAPLVAVGLMAHVGSRDETEGNSGLAHFFEHMMFQGSAHVAKMEHMKQIEALGGEVNADTTADRTYFHELVPKNGLELALWLEADRIVGLRVDQDHVDNQRQAVLEERRERIENKPYGLAHLRLDELAFGSWALGHATIGEVGDLQRAPLAAFKAFWQTWYTPQNLVLVLVGDVTGAQARPLLERTLGKVPRRSEVQHASHAPPEQRQHVYARHDETLAQTPAFHLAWRVPASPHPDALALDLLAEVLGGGPSSRLDKLLTRDAALATQYSAGTEGRRDVDVFQVYVEMARPGPAALDDAKKRVRLALFDIAAHGVTAEELQRVKQTFAAGWVFGTESLARKAEFLAQFELFEGDAAKVNGLLARYFALTSADLQRVANGLLTFDREVELDVWPRGHALPRDPGLKPAYVTKAESELFAAERAAAAAAAKAAADARAAAEAKVAAEAKAAADAQAAAERKAAAEAKAAADAQAAAERKAAAEAKAAADAQVAAERKAAAATKALADAQAVAERKAAAKAASAKRATKVAKAADLPVALTPTAPAVAPAAAPIAAPAANPPEEERADAQRAAREDAEAERAAAAARAAMAAKAAAQAQAAAAAKAAAAARAEAEARADAERRATAKAREDAERRAAEEARAAAAALAAEQAAAKAAAAAKAEAARAEANKAEAAKAEAARAEAARAEAAKAEEAKAAAARGEGAGSKGTAPPSPPEAPAARKRPIAAPADETEEFVPIKRVKKGGGGSR